MRAVRVGAREAIEEAGFAVLSANPRASLAEIAESAGVGAATLHRHFASREALIGVLADEGIAALAAAIDATEAEADATAALGALLETLIPLGARFMFLERYPLEDPSIEARYDAEAARLFALMERLAAEGVIAADLSPVQAAGFLEWVCWGLAESVADGHVARAEAPRLAHRLFTRGAGSTA